MSTRTPPPATRVGRALAPVLLLGLLGLTGCRSTEEPAPATRPATSLGGSPPLATRASGPPAGRTTVLTAADGLVPDGATVLDDRLPALTRLDPALLTALRRAAAEAAGDGVVIHLNSGWRSRSYQERLFAEAVARYGSQELAARWVARPGTSVHEAGDAVDVGGADATSWLAVHGPALGLCRVYGNEPWHVELRPEAAADGCPRPYADPTHDPRTR